MSASAASAGAAASASAAAAGAGDEVGFVVNKPFEYVVCVDGSKGSRACFEDVSSLYHPGDTVTVVTVAPEKDKVYLSPDEKPLAIKNYYGVRCARFGRDASVSIVTRAEGQDTAHALLAFLDKRKTADFIVVGFVGRKGSKADPTVFGSVTDMSLRAAHIPAVISKNQVAADVNHFFAGVDGSERAHDCVRLALRLARPQRGDRVTVIFVEDPSDKAGKGRFTPAAVEARYAAVAAENPHLAFRIVVRGKDQGIADSLLAAAEDEATHIIVGVDGVGHIAMGSADAARLGSTSDRVVRSATCSVICLQGRHGTYEDSVKPAHSADAFEVRGGIAHQRI